MVGASDNPSPALSQLDEEKRMTPDEELINKIRHATAPELLEIVVKNPDVASSDPHYQHFAEAFLGRAEEIVEQGRSARSEPQMTVGELIKMLGKMDPTNGVICGDPYGRPVFPIGDAVHGGPDGICDLGPDTEDDVLVFEESDNG